MTTTEYHLSQPPEYLHYFIDRATKSAINKRTNDAVTFHYWMKNGSTLHHQATYALDPYLKTGMFLTISLRPIIEFA